MDLTDEQRMLFSQLGKLSQEKRFVGMSKDEISEYMRNVRKRKKNPSQTTT